MPPHTKHQKKNKPAPYQDLSLEENNQKPAKKVKNQHDNNNTETRSENHVTMTRDVDLTQNATQLNTNNNNNAQEPLSITTNQTLQDNNLQDIEFDLEDWTDIQYNTRHKIFIPTEKPELKKRLDKKREIENLIPDHIRIVGSDIKYSGDIMYIKIDFPTAKDRLSAVEHLDTNNIQWKTNIQTNEQTPPNRKAEIIVRDIPLEITENDIRRQFNTYGDIQKIILKVNGAWQTANIIYQSEDTVSTHFKDKWSDIIRKDSVRIYLAEDYENNKETRNEFCAKLCNLPKHTTGFDIVNYIEEIGGKTCFIPRTKVQYDRVRYAYVNFESKEQLETVLSSQETHYMKNFNIFWTTTDTKTCHICQSRDHLAANCPRLQDRAKNEKRISKLANLYVKKKLDIPSAKNIIKKANNLKQQKQKSYSQVAQEGAGIHNTQTQSIEDRLSRIENLLDTALFAIQQIINKGIAQEERLELQKEIDLRNQQINKTPSKPPKSLNTHTNPTNNIQKAPAVKKSTNNKTESHKDNTIFTSIHAPIKDDSISIATDTRMTTLENNMSKVIHLLETLQNTTPKEASPTTPMQQ
jgi:hypothetical protein